MINCVKNTLIVLVRPKNTALASYKHNGVELFLVPVKTNIR